MSVIDNFLAEFWNPVYVETGSYKGDGIQNALDAGFIWVISIEASIPLWDHCKQRFWNDGRVTCLLGDSRIVLKELELPRATFFLDAHYCGHTEVNGKQVETHINASPLKEELAIIKRHGRTNTIIIDDMRLFRGHGIEDIIYAINEDYKIEYRDGNYKNDILIASL
jgi:hypothetical protein